MGEKGKKQGLIGEISARARFARRFLFFAHADFFSFFPEWGVRSQANFMQTVNLLTIELQLRVEESNNYHFFKKKSLKKI